MAEDASEKQHNASAKRIEDLQKQGQTMRSRDFTSGLVFLTGLFMIFYLSAHLKSQFESNFIGSFSHIKSILDGNDIPLGFLHKILVENFLILLPIFGIVFFITFLSPFIFGGWNFSMQAVGFKISKINPMNFFKKIFSLNIFLEVIRSFFKVIFIMSSLLYFIMGHRGEMTKLSNLPLKAAVNSSFRLIEEFLVVIAIALVFIVLVDVMYHFYEFQKRVKMTTQELKDESKDSEGSPEIKRKIRSMQYALLKQRLSQSVPKADVILTNPTHYSVALKYEDGKDKAPKVIAKGKGHIAQQIKTLAISNGITLYQAPALARAVYHTTHIGGEIHPDLYMAVAIVLSYVHQLRNFQHGLGPLPQQVTDFALPADFIFEE